MVNLSDAMIVSFEYREEPQSDVGQIEAKRYIFYAFVKACNPQQGSLCLIFMMFLLPLYNHFKGLDRP